MHHSYEGLERAADAPRGLLVPLRIRDFRLLWVGMCVSLLGDGAFLVALAWQVYQLSDAPSALGVVGVAMTVPTIAFLAPSLRKMTPRCSSEAPFPYAAAVSK